jgi:hypothetical protein
MNGGQAIAYGPTIAIVINKPGQWDAQAQASPGGLLVFGYYVDVPTVRYQTHTVTEADGNKPLVLYPDLTVGPPK